MSRRSKILLTGCLTPFLIICLCAGALYLQPERATSLISRFWRSEADQTLEVLAEQQGAPAVDWDVLEESGSIEPLQSSESTASESTEASESTSQESQESGVAVAQDAAVASGSNETLQVQFQGQTANLDPAALGVSRVAEISNDAGQPSVVLEYGEAELNSRLLPVMTSQMPPELEGQVNLDRIDLVPGAISIEGEVDTGFIGFQPLAITVVVGEDGRSLEILGVNVGGFALDAAGAGPLEEMFTQAESEINRAIGDLVIVASDGTELPLETVYLGEDMMQAVFER